MRVTEETLPGTVHKVTVAEYRNPTDFMRMVKRGCMLNKQEIVCAGGTGDTYEGFQAGIAGTNIRYTNAANDLVKQFSNVAVEEYGAKVEYNHAVGTLDYNAAMAGNPQCMFGVTVDRTDRSPVEIYIDPWVASGIKASVIEKRGVAILALIQALSVYRPVYAYILKGSNYSPLKRDTIQVLQIPTSPMNITQASYILCSPATNRHGLLRSIYAVHDNGRYCPSCPMTAREFHKNEMGGWLADKHGVRDYLFIRSQFNYFFDTDELVVAWIKEQLSKFIG